MNFFFSLNVFENHMSHVIFPPQCSIIPIVLGKILLNCLRKPNLTTCYFPFVTLHFASFSLLKTLGCLEAELLIKFPL